jgi:epidermal growth factor receptor substrate 15
MLTGFALAMSTFSPTPGETALTSQIFTLADPQNLGIVTGDAAVKVLSGANLSHAVLGEVWGIADKDNNGFLTRKGVAIALRLIGHAQKGEPVAESLLDKRQSQCQGLELFSC